ncbi:MAG TPA: VWA domain-containing protein [Candidatus Sulfotelmatobacter sp.]|nr:VWA domain-containing protein [Candidatus Sulfotelmatobacter sp.]
MKQPQISDHQAGRWLKRMWIKLLTVALAVAWAAPVLQAQSPGSQNQQQPSAKPQSGEEIPDAPSAVQPPPAKAPQDAVATPGTQQAAPPPPASQEQKPAPPPMPPVQTIPPGSMPAATSQGSGPRNEINPREDLYKFVVTTSFVQIPVLAKYKDGRRVEGLLSSDFEVLENGKPQKLTYFTSDPFQLSVAILLDLGMPDVAVQKVNQTYSSLVGAFSPYDEYALYTYSSTVSQVTDFTGRPERLTAALDSMKLVRGNNNGPAVLGGPLGPQPPMVNGMPVGTSGPPPVYTPPKEAHVLNDAILRAALDLSKRDRTRRKVIFVISDGRERGSAANYKEVLKVLETYGIQVKAVVLDSGALPVYKQVEKIHHVFNQGYADILPKYVNATGGGNILTELSRNAIENAYAQITSEARNQYTLGYTPRAVASSSAYRDIEVRVLGHGKDLNIYTKAGYYPIPSAH